MSFCKKLIGNNVNLLVSHQNTFLLNQLGNSNIMMRTF